MTEDDMFKARVDRLLKSFTELLKYWPQVHMATCSTIDDSIAVWDAACDLYRESLRAEAVQASARREAFDGRVNDLITNHLELVTRYYREFKGRWESSYGGTVEWLRLPSELAQVEPDIGVWTAAAQRVFPPKKLTYGD